ncbi:hypothetical protein Amet_4740 [Alkaliphilus metalliredigens QYMF]|uniref:MacB-like periplasmic core domain-containing protein n=1 Tax=Alkaliphilus metalliredigens (strain QYMF) TaxID=293826 RepID=A6TX88_ALKMQ|nr:ABC transporter permease [Alkaliphilus metalliredigens]ABR50806.1 hypothetical protein Amet_4740 [Alkaliphilus metalliredigens QYMF]
MRKRKVAWILTFSGILLMLSLIVLGNGLVVESSQLNGDYSMEKVLVSVKNHIDLQGINAFSIDDIKRLKRELATEEISYTVQSGSINTSVSNDSSTLPVRLTGVDHMYPLFYGLMIEEGSFITRQQEEEGAMVAVIDEELAWKLFKTVNATGKNIDIFGNVFRIIGVVKKDDTLIEKVTDEGLPKVYIPSEVILDIDSTSRITALQIKTDNAGRLDENVTNVSTALRQIGQNPSNYNIIDFNLRYELMEQLLLLFVFIIGMISIFILMVHAKNLIIKLYSLIRDGCKTDYLTNVIKYHRRIIATCFFEMTGVSLGIILFWLGIRFSPYIPSHYIPDELINISYYLDLIKSVIQGGIQDMGYVPPQSELILNATNIMVSLLFWISIVLGSLLLYTGFREIKTLNVDSNRLTLIFALFFLLSLGMLAVVAFMIKLPFILDVKSILVAWAFIFLNILQITNRKESDVKNVEKNNVSINGSDDYSEPCSLRDGE